MAKRQIFSLGQKAVVKKAAVAAEWSSKKVQKTNTSSLLGATHPSKFLNFGRKSTLRLFHKTTSTITGKKKRTVAFKQLIFESPISPFLRSSYS